MLDNPTFVYCYIAKENEEIRDIRKKYIHFHPSNPVMKQRKGIIMNKNDQEFLVQRIRTQYTEKEQTELQELKALDAKVKRPANVFGYVFGSISAIILGSGMSLIMTEIGEMVGIGKPMFCGIVIGIIGMLMAIVNYPMYQKILNARRKKFADQIIALSDKIIQG